jgi:hypothetical protein
MTGSPVVLNFPPVENNTIAVAALRSWALPREAAL